MVDREERYMWLSLALPFLLLLGASACDLDSVQPLEPSKVHSAMPTEEAHRRESLLLRLCRGKPLVRKKCEEKVARENEWD